LLLIVLLAGYTKLKVDRQQSKLQPFYSTSGLALSGPLGQVMKSEPLGVHVANGTAFRILYRTQRSNGAVTFASGMVFIPNNNVSGSPRPVVAWAHGTVGMGDQCAPSRTPNPLNAIPWVSEMLSRGWVVTATDYAGLGTPGTEAYLVGGDESNDVLNSVRALKYLPNADASSYFAIWGHSQGGNSALFSASNVASYAPELHLVGTVASAPAAELVPLLNETQGTALDWVIGPEVALSWPATYPNLSAANVLTSAGNNNYQRIANQCITQSAIGGLIRNKAGQTFFKGDLTKSPNWLSVAKAQSAPILSKTQPLLVAESLTDQVVLPNTTALYIQKACSGGSDLTSLWLTNVGHIQLSSTIAPEVIGWIGDRFAGLPNVSNCSQPSPITPAPDD
jgi:alpha-beta hydrolase superfamily lysophospholipase